MKKNATSLNINADVLAQEVMKYKYSIFNDDATSRFVADKQEKLLRIQLPEVETIVGWDGEMSPEVLIAYSKDKNRFELSFLKHYIPTLKRMLEALEGNEDEALERVVCITPEIEWYFQHYPKLMQKGIVHRISLLIEKAEDMAYYGSVEQTTLFVRTALQLAEAWLNALELE